MALKEPQNKVTEDFHKGTDISKKQVRTVKLTNGKNARLTIRRKRNKESE